MQYRKTEFDDGINRYIELFEFDPVNYQAVAIDSGNKKPPILAGV
jgi:hypothetical protein